ncbi:MAG: putative manganese-dependent inorganic diphosphatase [Clostridiales bacterium]|jgi:manganese-dependent inorganic pyrophosphatase|nr:putative manganese-dependent inorganic diphosphatase [Clostridiales bacterium]
MSLNNVPAHEHLHIFGHKNPDTDSICSAIAYAHLKRELGFRGAKAYRLGEINKETDFALKHFGIKKPPILHDVRLKLRDLELYQPDTLKESEPVKKAWDMLISSDGSRIIPIVSESKAVKGILAMGDVTRIFMEVSDEDVVKRHEILYRNLVDILGGVHVGGEYKYEKLEGSLYVGTNFGEETVITDKDVVITGKVDNAWRLAYEYNFGCIILTNGVKPKGLEGAKCAVVCVDYSVFKAISLVSQAISVGSLMNVGNVVTFSENNYLDDVSDVMRVSKHRNFPVLDKTGALYGIVSRRHLMASGGKKVILIDHNERSQSVEGLEQAEIVEIIDHHRVADIQTESPLYIRSEPVGCTATIIARMYRENRVAIPKEIAGAMLSAILSDTLMFSSPTCTPSDKAAAEALATIAEVDIMDYGRAMFKAGTAVEKTSVEQMLAMDRKRFTFGKTTAYISQINTLDFAGIASRVDEIFRKMRAFYDKNPCDLVMLMITDIVAGGSEILAVGRAKDLLDTAFGMKISEDHIFLPGVVSRKKQIVPVLTQIATTGIREEEIC